MNNTSQSAVNKTSQQQVETPWQPQATPIKQDVLETATVKPKSTRGRQPVDKHGLTRKQKAFADYMLDNPKASATEAAKHAYSLSNPASSTASTIGVENSAKPSIQAYMAAQGHEASTIAMKLLRLASKNANNRVVTKDGTEILGRDNVAWARLGFDISEGINDRIHGKATTRTESASVNLNIQSVLD